MPTPVSVVREYLTPEASLAVDQAVVIARKRNHAQTTSIHALSAFLSLPNFPLLRDSISRVRSSVYSSRLQLKALELCFNVSLDRIPSSKTPKSKNGDGDGGGDGDEPPISNSFMAAIKRSQATQKRYPENFHLNHQTQNQQAIVKVELQPLILSILDDPVVSRVFSEAGFRNYDIKVAILRPPPTTTSRVFSSAPLFLCNFEENDEFSRKGFSFPFSSGFSNHGGLSNFDDEQEFKRIVEVLQNKEQRNPLLVGVSATDVLHSFCGSRGNVVLPVGLSGLRYISIEDEIMGSMNGNEGLLISKFQELERLLETCSGPGIVISFGDLKGFVDGNCDGSFVVTGLMKLLECNSEKLWLMGSASSYETYLKLIRKFPSVEKDWDLKLLPITSLRATNGGVCASRPHSLMESFVPLGGFFSTPSDLGSPITDNPSISCCKLCNEKYEQEVTYILEGGSIVSVADHYKANFSSWMQPNELSPDKVNVDRAVINAKEAGLRKKWIDICQRLGHASPATKAENSRVGSYPLPCIVGFPSPSKNLLDCVPPSMVSPKLYALNPRIPSQLVSKYKDDDIGPKLQHATPLRSECFHIEGLSSRATSVTTDLGLGTLYASNSAKEPNNPIFQAHKERLQEFSGCSPSRVDVVSTNALSIPIRPSSYSNTHSSGHFDPTDIKTLWQSIIKRVGRQNEAVYGVSETISHCKTGNGRRRGTSLRGDIWFSFLGPDRVAKKKIAEALAEIICGSKKNLTVVDLSSEDGMTSSTIFGSQELNDYDLKFRGKTVVDYIAEEIKKKPLSVVFLENVDKADAIAQDSLIQAIRTSKLHQWNGREVAVNNSIFIATSEVMKDRKMISWGKEHIKFHEERIVRAESWQMQILIGHVPEGTAILKYSSVSVTSRTSANKRKLIGIDEALKQPEIFERIKKACKTLPSNYIDLNLPAEEETEESDAKCLNSEASNSASENSETWLEDFFDQVDKNVVFKPFDFDTLADKALKEMDKTLHDTFDESTKISLEVDLEVMEQMLAAAWLCDDKAAIEVWVRQVLGRSIIETRQQYFNDRPTSGSVLKLVACEGLRMKEEANTIRLPETIILNRL